MSDQNLRRGGANVIGIYALGLVLGGPGVFIGCSAPSADDDADVGDDSVADVDILPEVDVPVDADDVVAEADGDVGEETEVEPVCGNGVLEDGEECDTTTPRDCTTSCDSTGAEACVACRWAGACTPPAETCNGIDDDCDGETDEGCVEVGAPCTGDADCGGGELLCNESWGICVVASCTGRPSFRPCELISVPDRAYDICSNGACVSPGCGDATCNVPGPSFPLADSGQRACHDDAGVIACPGIPGVADCGTTAFCGQDAQYGWDADHDPGDRFARAGVAEPIVTDNITGRVWMGCSVGQAGASCTGTATVLSWSDALAYCDDLVWGGHSDWRLPDEYELQSLLDYGATGGLFIDPAAFPAVPSSLGPSADASLFWSSSSDAADPVFAWSVAFHVPWVANELPKPYPFYVRCVRSDPAEVPAARFTRTEPVIDFPVVADAATGLVWQGCAAGQTGTSCTGSPSAYTWQAALTYCESSSWAGFNDWYVPNPVELFSLTDNGRAAPSIDTTVFPGTPFAYWSSTAYSGFLSTLAWLAHFGLGDVPNTDTTNEIGIRCVRRAP